MAEKTILVVEDNDMNMKLMRAVLKIGKYGILEATDAETGLSLAREHRPDLILMDIQLPAMDGISATRILKADSDLSHIPVFALSGFAMESEQEKAKEAGFAGYIVKPVSVKVLLETLADYFNGPQGDKV